MMQRIRDGAIGAAATAAVLAAVAYAAIPDAGGVIHACYSNGGLLQQPGALRVIDSGQTCRNSEVALSWNVQGRTGPQGVPGPRGPAGPTGAGVLGDSTFSAGELLPGCNLTVVLAIPITVTRPSRIYVHGAGSYHHNTSSATDGLMQVRLRNAADTATLAVANAAVGFTSGYANATLDSSGVLRAGTGLYQPIDPAEPPFVAAPGSYLLQMVATGGFGSCSGSPLMMNDTLTYLLLNAN